MFILHLALGGCLKAPPISFGVTADTGGHIAYVIDAAIAQAALSSVTKISIVTRLFNDDQLGREHGLASEPITNKITIDRVATANRTYLEKEALAADLPAFTAALCTHLAMLPRLPDVIHAHFADAAAVALVARSRFDIAVVYTPHALGLDKRAQQAGSDALDERIAGERCAIAMADAIVVSTRDEADRQLLAYDVAGAAGRIHCFPPGVPHRQQPDPSETLPGRLSDWLLDPHKPIVLAIARPVRKKNLAAIVRAYTAVSALADKANLVIIAGQHGGCHSSAEEQEVIRELAQLCAVEGLRGRVALPPQHNSADVVALYRQAALGGVFVNPALHEPFGLTLIEAAAVGVPVVATRNGGPVEIVNTIGHGVLVDPRNEAAIGMACLSIVSDADLHHRLSQAARRNVHCYNWSTYAQQSVSLYASLSRAPRRALNIGETITDRPSSARSFAAGQDARPLPFIVATGRSIQAVSAVHQQRQWQQPKALIADAGTRIMLPPLEDGWRKCPDYFAMLVWHWDQKVVAPAWGPLSLTPQPAVINRPHELSVFGLPLQATLTHEPSADLSLRARIVFSHRPLTNVLAPHANRAAAITANAVCQGQPSIGCLASGDNGNKIDTLWACGYEIVVTHTMGERDALPRPQARKRVSRQQPAYSVVGPVELGVPLPGHQVVVA